MNPEPHNPPESRLAKISTVFWSYSLAVVLAFCLSIPSSLFLLFAGTPIWLISAITGFVGVFFSSYCVPRSSRWFCAMFLSIPGAGYYYFRFIRRPASDAVILPENSLMTLALGSTAAVVIHLFCRWSGKEGQLAEIITPAVVSDK
ncbi:MAG TPA: hypothetical protein VGH19_02885 [Verrucomicrobiae bacterium]